MELLSPIVTVFLTVLVFVLLGEQNRLALQDWIWDTYHFIYYEVLQRNEPFTWQFCRIEENSPYVFWLIVTSITVLLGSVLLNGNWWQQSLATYGLGFVIWFTPHIIDSIQEHNHEPNPHD